MKKKNKQIIAALAVSIGLIIIFLCMIFEAMKVYKLEGLGILGVIGVYLALIILTVYLLNERIREIKGGEEDDLSKY